jgi:methylated-DNA-[protein]-cysteine S-methyltransferase
MAAAPTAALTLRTNWGPVIVRAEEGALVACELPTLARRPATALRITGRAVRAATAADRRVLQQAERFIRALWTGRQMRRPPLRWKSPAPFLASAWKALLDVPRGCTVTYAGLAARVGRPGAARAAGQACARNPLPLFVPCHRVLASGGALGGFSGGLAWKVFLLQQEGARPAAGARA